MEAQIRLFPALKLDLLEWEVRDQNSYLRLCEEEEHLRVQRWHEEKEHLRQELKRRASEKRKLER